MAGRRQSRDDLRWSRRTQHYQDKLAAAGTTLARLGVASDWCRALLVEVPPDVRTAIGEQAIGSLLSVVAVVERQQKGGRA